MRYGATGKLRHLVDEIIFSWPLIKHLEKSVSLRESQCANEAEGVMMTVISITKQ